jgi:hypothetical protein
MLAEEDMPWTMAHSAKDIGELQGGEEQTPSLRLELSALSGNQFLECRQLWPECVQGKAHLDGE